MKLNLGAGNRIMADAINHDRIQHRPEIEVAHDLNSLPWPWPDDHFDFIVARAVLEHLRLNLVESMDECWRLLRPGGQIFVKLPYWAAAASYRDPSHYWRFSLDTLDAFDPDTEYGQEYSFYTARKWKILSRPELNRGQTSILATLEVRK